jgi:hypothetical protein
VFSHRFAFQLYFVSIVNQAIEDRVSQGGVPEIVMPASDGELTGNNRRFSIESVIECYLSRYLTTSFSEYIVMIEPKIIWLYTTTYGWHKGRTAVKGKLATLGVYDAPGQRSGPCANGSTCQ